MRQAMTEETTSRRRQTPVMAALLVATVMTAWAGSLQAEVTVKKVDKKVRVEIDGELFTEYIYQDWPRPYLFPVLAPGGESVTRSWPMKDGVAGEQKDHPHHRGLWHGHQYISGHDLWHQGGGKGQIVHQDILEMKSGDVGVLKVRNRWFSPQQKEILATDEVTYRFFEKDGARILDFDVLVKATHGDVVFGDEKDGFVAMRVNPALRVKNAQGGRGTGSALNSAGQKDAALWGQAAKWLDYWGPIDGKTVGIAMFDHPGNLRHPTTWHARDYGLVTANPFGTYFFTGEKGPRQAGKHTLKAGESLQFRYRFYIHNGDATQAKIVERYEQYTKEKDE